MSDSEEDPEEPQQALDGVEKRAPETKENLRFNIQRKADGAVLWHGPVGEGAPTARGLKQIKTYATTSWRNRLKTIVRKIRELEQDMHDMELECELALLVHSIKNEPNVFVSDFLKDSTDVVFAAKQAMIVLMAEKAKKTAMAAVQQARFLKILHKILIYLFVLRTDYNFASRQHSATCVSQPNAIRRRRLARLQHVFRSRPPQRAC